MALTAAQRASLKAVYKNLEDRPLLPDDPLYEPAYSHEGADDPVQSLYSHISLTDVESLQLFSGFRGSGKTTELFRLRKRLQDDGYVVLYGDALKYLNPAEPVDITLLLVALAGSFSDALEAALGIDIAGESYWGRLRNYLTKTTLAIQEAGVKADLESPLKDYIGGVKTEVDVKLALQTTPTFRQRLQQFLTSRLGEQKADVEKFVEDGVKAVRKKFPDAPGIVFLFDSLEQLRGSVSNEEQVTRSVEFLFSHHIKMLELPYVHMVCCVPPWIQFVMPGIAPIVVIPSVRLWNNDDGRSPYGPGWKFMRSLVRKRLAPVGAGAFFGEPGPAGEFAGADRLIEMCGGHFRDLMLLLREIVRRSQSLPVGDTVVESAITAVRNNFLPIAIEDAHWLEQIGRMRSPGLPSSRSEDAARLTRFLDTHFVLYLTNGKAWYDIHPLIRSEVSWIVASHPRGNGGDGPA